MRTLCAVLLLFCLVILFVFWVSYQIQNLCTELLVYCDDSAPCELLDAWNDKKAWFSFAVNRGLLKELEVNLHVWQSCPKESQQFQDAKQRCRQLLTNIQSAYGIYFACAF